MTVVNVTDAILQGTVNGPTFVGQIDGLKFSGSVTYADPVVVPPPVVPPPVNTFGVITNFVNTNGGSYTVDGFKVGNNSTHPWSVTKIDDYTTRIEVRPGDVWSSSGGSYTDPRTSERCEISAADGLLKAGVLLNWEATVTVPVGPPITSNGAMILQLHATPEGNTPCPFSIQIEGPTKKLRIIAQEPSKTWTELYYGPANGIVRGQPMNIKCKVKMGATGNGSALVMLDGNTIVNFTGKIGASTSSTYYWKWGIYRNAAPETLQVDFSNVHMYTG